MLRLLFEKTGDAVWMSHLDLMRLFQRAFQRAGLPLKHTQGFNPRPSVSIALPLSVGMESVCELLDFSLEGAEVPETEIRERLNEALIPGVRVRECYADGRKIRELALLDCVLRLEYDKGPQPGLGEEIAALFSRESLLVEKRGKNGVQQQDIIPMIRSLEVKSPSETALELQARICCQNPSLNPMQMVSAIEKNLPEDKPDAAWCTRVEVYDAQGNIFR